MVVDVLHVDHDLRVHRHRRCELGERLALPGHLAEQVQAGEDAVARRGELAHDDVAGLLTAQRVVVAVHLFEHVAVADRGLDHADPVLAHREFEAQVAHHRGDEGVLAELAALFHAEREDRHDLVAVDDIAVRVDGEAAVGVSVVGDTHIGAGFEHGASQVVEVGRPDPVVDVHAVGRVADHGDASTRIREYLRRDAGGCAVGAVKHHVDALEAMRQAGEQVQHVAVFGVGEPADAADRRARRRELLHREVLFDTVFDDVGELGAAAGEDLDAVVWRGVVRCRHHDAEVGVEVGDQERRCRGGDDTGVIDVDPRAGESCRDRSGDELTGDARVARNDGGGTFAGRSPRLRAAALRQDSSSCLRKAEREVGGE